MIIIKLKGGLGNQLFQYATAKALALRHNTMLRIDHSNFETYKLHDYGLYHFNITDQLYKKEPKWLAKIEKKLKLKTFYNEDDHGFRYNNELKHQKAYKLFLDGYFQCEDYFLEYRQEILEALKITSPLKPITKQTLETINSCSSVALHVRRGDYLLHDVHNTDKAAYYDKAMSYIESKVENPIYFMFSDDIDWVKENFSSKHQMVFIDFNDASTNYEDIKLMSNCKHNIIANSSFSWWSAWLNTNPEKIITAPKHWFNGDMYDFTDLVPKSWIKF
ncbi:alpha-1,2-fucosyltransferase [Aurantibacter aestuarii]|uniref:Alpha-1,2-fucosyltransferase n=1 Tax=Aurantibacter aestuarii TaxID=1266046 RepID=A0A2T1N5G2_9FLAO|nr:alpha-1,2-fucosyltransferase [Aurantibacter aestuarii]PSG86522.1 hypothetical protein C7H52_12625 [Aurantibacter aestuarii]